MERGDRMPEIKRSDFNKALQGKSLDVDQLKQDQRLGGMNVDKADINNDGKISGSAETDALYLEVDRFDKNGSYASMDRNNQAVATKMEALADIGDISSFRALANTGAPGRTGRVDGPQGTTNPQAMAESAKNLVKDRENYFGVDQPWMNSDPNHALPANVRLGGLKGKWKCNLFGGNAMYNAGFEPPYYGNKGKGEYPNANQMYKWSDKHAGKYGNKVHFEMKGELDVSKLSGDEKKKKIANLLAQAKPGDMIVVDHMGDDVADGGHVRVVTGNNHIKPDGSGTLDAAQASHSRAEIQQEGVSDFTGEEKIWILRPNRPRAGNP